MRAIVSWLALALLPHTLHAQITPTIPAPPLLPNYERVSVGEREALEAGAYIARSDDANANWYNPAGLALVDRTGANLSTSAYEATTIELANFRRKTNTLRLAPLGGFFGLAVGTPLTSSERLRYGVFVAHPVTWRTGTVENAITPDSATEAHVTSEATLARVEPGVAMGFSVNDRLRVGSSLALAVTTTTVSQSVFFQIVESDSAATLRRDLVIDGSAWHLIPRLAFQWDVSDRWRVGGIASAPGMQLTGRTKLAVGSGDYVAGGSYNDATLYDQNARFDLSIPFAIGLGLAWTYPRGSIEGTVRYHGSSSQSELVSTAEQARLVQSQGGTSPVVSSVPVGPLLNSWRAVTNAAIGGNYGLTERLRLHLGFSTDGSPVRDQATSIFSKLHLIGGTAGISYKQEGFRASLGLGYSTGRSNPVPQLQGITERTVETRLKISTFRVMYSFSARF